MAYHHEYLNVSGSSPQTSGRLHVVSAASAPTLSAASSALNKPGQVLPGPVPLDEHLNRTCVTNMWRVLSVTFSPNGQLLVVYES